MSQCQPLYLDGSRLVSALTAEQIQLSILRLHHRGLGISMSKQDYPCWSAWKDAPPPTPSFSSPSLALPAFPPPSIVLDSKSSTPDWPCWSAWKDAPAPTPSSSSPLLEQPVLRPPSIVLDSKTLTQNCPCWPACMD